MSQHQYLINLLRDSGFDNKTPCRTPMEVWFNLLSDGKTIPNPTEYRRILGSLQYLTTTRPDIAFAVNKAGSTVSS